MRRAGYAASRSSRTWDHVLIDHAARYIYRTLKQLVSNWFCHGRWYVPCRTLPHFSCLDFFCSVSLRIKQVFLSAANSIGELTLRQVAANCASRGPAGPAGVLEFRGSSAKRHVLVARKQMGGAQPRKAGMGLKTKIVT